MCLLACVTQISVSHQNPNVPFLGIHKQATSYGFVGNSALHYAAAKGHTDLLRLLILAKVLFFSFLVPTMI